MQNQQNQNTTYIWFIALVAAMGGLLFGYDWVVIGGAKPFYEAYLNITEEMPLLRGWTMTSALIGCLFGAMIAGALTDRYGRRRLLITAAVLFTASAIGTGLAWDLKSFWVFRIMGGLGIGIASTVSPMYIAEIAPADVRGKFVAINQLTIVIGIVIAQVVNWLIARPIPDDATVEYISHSWNGLFGWRWMFGAETVPAFGFFLLMLFIPESPRWLVKYGRQKEAEKILKRIGGEDYAQLHVSEIKETLSQNEIARVNYKDLLEPALLKIIALGVFLAVFQQWSGINVIFNYAHEVFTAAGFGISGMLFNVVITGLVMLVFTVIAVFCADKLGRRMLMLLGAAGLAAIYAVLGAGYYFNFTGIYMLILVLAAIAVYSMTLAPMVWVILSEIFPNRIRGAAMSIAVFGLWGGCAVLTFTFPYLNQSLGAHGTFWVYGGICLISFIIIFAKLPETTGKTLEQLESDLNT